MTDGGPRNKPRRLGLPKVKSGCVTCKARRVKCGEEKPECHRCLKFGIDCGGYKPPKTPKTTQVTAIVPKSTQPRPLRPQGTTGTISPNEIITKLFETQQEHDYFETFCTSTIFDILPTFHTQVLQRTLLQACANTPSIRNAVAALGALDKTSRSLGSLTLSLDSSEQKDSADQHHQNALKTYSKAVRGMRADALNGEQDLRITLLTCLVIMCFEAWNGNHALAVNQISLAFKLIRAWKEGSVGVGSIPPRAPQPTNEVEDDLILAFSRLDVQVISLAQEPVHGYQAFPPAEEIRLLDSMPLVFQTVDEAECYETVLVRRAMRFLTSEVPLPKPAPTTHAFPLNGWWGVTDPDVVNKKRVHIAYSKHWFAAIDPLWNKLGSARFSEWWSWRTVLHEKITEQSLGRLQSSPLNGVERDKNLSFERAAMFRVHTYTAWSALVIVCAQDESEYDAMIPIYAEIVDLCHYLLEQETLAKKNNGPTFSFDSYVVIPLHMTGQKCRDPIIRRKAIWLLYNYPRREGVWDSLLIVRVIEWVMSIEEEHIEGDYVPSWARLHGIQIERDMEKKTALLKCEQRSSIHSMETTTRAKVIRW